VNDTIRCDTMIARMVYRTVLTVSCSAYEPVTSRGYDFFFEWVCDMMPSDMIVARSNDKQRASVGRSVAFGLCVSLVRYCID